MVVLGSPATPCVSTTTAQARQRVSAAHGCHRPISCIPIPASRGLRGNRRNQVLDCQEAKTAQTSNQRALETALYLAFCASNAQVRPETKVPERVQSWSVLPVPS